MTRLTWIVSLILLLCTSVAGQTNLLAGTRLRVQMRTPVDTKTSHVGDVIEALLIEPVTERGSILLPVGTRLKGRVANVSPENKAHQTHALLQLSFESLDLPDGQHIQTQAIMRSLGLAEDVDGDGTATIYPLSHDFALKSGRIQLALTFRRAVHENDRPLSEEEIRVELAKVGCTIVEIEMLIQRACWFGVRSLNENYGGSQRSV